MNNKYTFVMFAMSSWFEWQERGITNTNRQILKALLVDPRVERVVLINYLPFSLKRILREFVFSKLWKKKKNTVLYGGIYRVDKESEKLLIVSSLFSFSIKKILKRLNIKDFIIWSFNPMNVSWLDFKKTKIFTAIDDWSLHPIYRDKVKKLNKNYSLIDKNVNYVFTVSDELKNKFNNKACYYIPNAVDFDHFYLSADNKEKWFNTIKEDQFSSIKRPIIGYVGVIQERFNIELFEYLLKNNPNCSFVIIGHVWVNMEKKLELLKQEYNNLYLCGPIDYKIMPYYMNQFDIGLIPHHVNKFTASMNPLKIYEYLSCGVPVISTVLAYTELDNLIYYATDKVKFNDHINNILQTKIDKSGMITAAKQETWSKRIQRIFDLIKIA